MTEHSSDATTSLLEHADGDAEGTERLFPVVYDHLRALAGKVMLGERPDHTLQPTALVHEVYLRLIDGNRVDWKGKSHFCAVAARQMRRILIDHARKALAQKRGQRPQRVTLLSDVAIVRQRPLDGIALAEALVNLEQGHPRQCKVAEMRVFSGMEVKEIASVLGISPTTVKDDWRFAKAWLTKELGASTGQA